MPRRRSPPSFSSSTGATATTVSPVADRATRTPVASRPWSEISLDAHADDIPAGGEHEYLVVVGDRERADDAAPRRGDLHAPHALAAPALRWNRSSLVRFPWPLELTNSITAPSPVDVAAHDRVLASFSFMPRTPAVARPMAARRSRRSGCVMPVARHHEDVVSPVVWMTRTSSSLPRG